MMAAWAAAMAINKVRSAVSIDRVGHEHEHKHETFVGVSVDATDVSFSGSGTQRYAMDR